MKTLRKQEVEKVLKNIYKESIATIKVQVSEKISINKGISKTTLFTTVLKKAFKNLEWEEIGIKINGD